MESASSLFCCLIPGFRRNPNRRREQKPKETLMEKQRNKIKQITRLRVSTLYSLKKARILHPIDFDYSRILIVWVLSEEVLRTSVISYLDSFDSLVRIQDRWSIKEDATEAWKGVIAEFASARDAETASINLPMLIRHVRSTPMKTVIETLVDCELLSLENKKNKEEQGSTKVVICRKVPFRHQEVEDMHRNLSTYGNMQTFFINHRLTAIGAVCEVTYPNVTHAYLALLMSDGQRSCRGTLMASLEKTEKQSEILKDAKVCIKYLEQQYFPN